ncbi:MAG: hypothetical protein SGI72_04560 [Planctomycetota bacterium]|nr:hypothetical protein [Planctomycetota bacterium]
MSNESHSIGDLENELENALTYIRELDARGGLPAELRPLLMLAPVEGTSIHISLRHRDHARQMRRSYGSHAFNQRECAAWIVFEAPPVEGRTEERRFEREESFDRRPSREFDRDHDRRNEHDPMEDFVRALDDAENQPQLKFVSLKWFRDTYLFKMGFPWAEDPDVPRRLLQDATDRSMILTDKVANPKQPAFPVTSIFLNREHPDVQHILGGGARD